MQEAYVSDENGYLSSRRALMERGRMEVAGGTQLPRNENGGWNAERGVQNPPQKKVWASYLFMKWSLVDTKQQRCLSLLRKQQAHCDLPQNVFQECRPLILKRRQLMKYSCSRLCSVFYNWFRCSPSYSAVSGLHIFSENTFDTCALTHTQTYTHTYPPNSVSLPICCEDCLNLILTKWSPAEFDTPTHTHTHAW